eukprot:6141534-Pyramimonas_sp.AAC.1
MRGVPGEVRARVWTDGENVVSRLLSPVAFLGAEELASMLNAMRASAVNSFQTLEDNRRYP